MLCALIGNDDLCREQRDALHRKEGNSVWLITRDDGGIIALTTGITGQLLSISDSDEDGETDRQEMRDLRLWKTRRACRDPSHRVWLIVSITCGSRPRSGLAKIEFEYVHLRS